MKRRGRTSLGGEPRDGAFGEIDAAPFGRDRPPSESWPPNTVLIFISYAHEDQVTAQEVSLALTQAGHRTFLDRASLPYGREYHQRIREAVSQSDVFIFLASPESLTLGSYALTELSYASDKWSHPDGHVIPVRIRGVSVDVMPAYLRAVTVLEPQGNVAADIAKAVGQLNDGVGRRGRAWMVAAAIIVAVAAAIGWYVIPRHVVRVQIPDRTTEQILLLAKQLNADLPESDRIKGIDSLRAYVVNLGENRYKDLAVRELKQVLLTDKARDNREIRQRLMEAISTVRARELSQEFSGGELERIDLVGADLRQTDLNGVSLRGAFLIETDFRGATLQRATFADAFIRNVKLSGADLSGADLTNADWFNAVGVTIEQLRTARSETVLRCPADKRGRFSDVAFHAHLPDRYTYAFDDWGAEIQTELRRAWREYAAKGGVCDLLSR